MDPAPGRRAADSRTPARKSSRSIAAAGPSPIWMQTSRGSASKSGRNTLRLNAR